MNRVTIEFDVSALNFDKGNGTVSVVCQDAKTGTVLMVAAADREALEATQRTGEMHYRSRSRGLWHKGSTSGHVQRVVSLWSDCDGDAVLARVIPTGPACHNGNISCFGEVAHDYDVLGRLQTIVDARRANPHEQSYTSRLLNDKNLRLKKIGEEAVELAVACADGSASQAVSEAADLLYHVVVALSAVGVSVVDVARELAQRESPRVPLQETASSGEGQ